jgi:hypothetical protein
MFGRLKIALRWLGVRLLVAVALWAVVYTAANYYLTRERDQAMAWFTANGIPTYPEQFTKPEVAVTDDAGPYWRAAGELAPVFDPCEELCSSIPGANSVDVTLKDGQLIIYISGEDKDVERPLTADELTVLKKSLAAHEAVFDLLHQAAAKPKYDSPINYSQGIVTLFPPLGPAMKLARLLALAADVAVYEGRIDQAIDYWRSLRALERWTADEPTLVASLVTVSIDGLLCESIQRNLHSKPFSDNELKRVAAILEPCRGYREQFRLAIRAELPTLNVFVRDMLAGRFDMSAFNVADLPPVAKAAGLFRLTLLADQTVSLQYYRRLHEQSKTDFQPDQLPTVNRDALPWYASTTRMLTPAINNAAKAMCRIEATHRVTTWGVALRLHWLASLPNIMFDMKPMPTRSYPECLAGIEPEFAKGLGQPTDPFTGAPLIYHRQGSGFIVYSVGPNLKDDGGRNDQNNTEIKGVLDDIAVEFKD